MSNNTINEQVSLYFCQGGSDKVYHAQITQENDLFLVNFQYGRRGSALTSGTKTASPLPFDKAKKIYDKLVAEKTAKGYSPGEAGTVYKGTALEARATGVQHQLLNAIAKSEVDFYLDSDDYVMQQKHDGERRGVKKEAEIIGINRKGLSVALSAPIADAVAQYDADLLLDGEDMGDVLYAFDILELDGEDLRSMSYRKRLEILKSVGATLPEAIRVVDSYYTTTEKRDAYEAIMEATLEGVVFKRLDAPWQADRPATGGPALKFKFYDTVTVEVVGQNEGKRSVAIAVYDNSVRIPIGNVTIPPNKAVPVAGTFAEVKYLYAYALPGGSLYQPEFLFVRDDVGVEAATVSQLKFKSESVIDGKMQVEEFIQYLTKMGLERSERSKCLETFRDAGENEALQQANEILARKSAAPGGLGWIDPMFEKL